MNIASLRASYISGEATPQNVFHSLREQIVNDSSSNAWIYVLSEKELEVYLQQLAQKDIASSPLWGIPFAIKDNIDLAGVPTTAACPEFAYTPEENAFVVEQLIQAGAIPLGKTNLDQFATGLVGTRSPFGAVGNAFNKEYVSGGSSSGSAYALAKGQVSFSLGTDTAGSGRVPAAFHNILGSKLSLGLVSCSGVVPACRSLDCVSFFSLCAQDAQTIMDIASCYDTNDCYAREKQNAKGLATQKFTVGVPKLELLEFFGHTEYPRLFQAACEQLSAAGAELVEIDIAPFIQAATLLYQGPWVAERYHAVGEFIQTHKDLESLDPSVANIILAGDKASAVTAFDGMYQLKAYKQQADKILRKVDSIVIPTVAQHYRIDEMQRDPIRLNSHFGYYTNFMNLLDYSALAIPAGFTSKNLPFGITLFAPAFHDQLLLDIASLYLARKNWGMGLSETRMPVKDGVLIDSLPVSKQGYIQVAVCGAHLQGMPLNWQLQERQAKFITSTKTTETYRFYALAGGPPKRPGLMRVNTEKQRGEAIAIEVWAVPQENFGSFVAGIPEPLGIGKVELASGEWVPGFICEASGLEGAEDITHYGNWRDYINR